MSQGAANVWPYMWSTSAHDANVRRLYGICSRRLQSNFIHDFREAGCDPTLPRIRAGQTLGLVHGLWIEHRIWGALSVDEVLGIFDAAIDYATGLHWRQALPQQASQQRKLPMGDR